MSEVLKPKQFEEQFAHRKEISSYSGKADYIDLHPEKAGDRLPVLVAPGWSEGPRSLEETGQELFDKHRRALVVEHARRGGIKNDSLIFADEVLHKANTLMTVLDDAGVERADVIAHSEGALNAVAAALQHPERFRSIVLAMPAGMIGNDSVGKLVARFAPKMARSLTKDTYENPKIGVAINAGGAKYIAKNPNKAFREVKAMANTRIDDVLSNLRSKGVKVGVLQSNADTVFPPDRIGENVELDGPFANVDSYSSVADKKAGHDDLLIHPERSTNAAARILDYLNSEQKYE